MAKAQKSGKGKDAAKAKGAKKAARAATVEAEAAAELDATNGAAPFDAGPALAAEPAPVAAEPAPVVAAPKPERKRRRAADAIGASRPEPTLRILETRVLRGPNYWAREPVIRQVVDLGVLEEFPSNKIPGFADALAEMLPTLEDHACSLGQIGRASCRERVSNCV